MNLEKKASHHSDGRWFWPFNSFRAKSSKKCPKK